MRYRQNDLPAHGGHFREPLSATQIGTDGGERTRAEETAASESEARFQAREELLQIFLKNLPAGVAMLDRRNALPSGQRPGEAAFIVPVSDAPSI